MERNDQGKPFDRILFLDASGLQFAERHAASNGFDPRTRPWYRAAVNGKAPVAIGPYEMATTGNLGMTISQAHRGNPKSSSAPMSFSIRSRIFCPASG